MYSGAAAHGEASWSTDDLQPSVRTLPSATAPHRSATSATSTMGGDSGFPPQHAAVQQTSEAIVTELGTHTSAGLLWTQPSGEEHAAMLGGGAGGVEGVVVLDGCSVTEESLV